jgi:prepilin-type N-terminal cleavage/methylation domain-containing protein
MKDENKNHHQGFTLIEIMLALLVVTIGIVATIGLLGTSLDTSAKSHDDLNIVSFADMVFNYCHSETNWNSIPSSGNLTVPDYDLGTEPLQIGSLAQFTSQVPGSGNTPKTYTVSYLLKIQPIGNTKQLTLQVWSGPGTNNRPRTFYTELYNRAKN